MTYTLLFQKEDTVANFNGITTGTGAITLTAGNFSVSGTQLFVLDGDTANAEVVSATVSGTTLTLVSRGLDGTSAVTHTAGCKVGMYFVPSHYGDLGKVGASDAWTSHTATLGGFSGTPTQDNAYQKLGKSVLIRISISGTSNATSFTFSLPYASKVNQHIIPTSAQDSGAYVTATLPSLVLAASSTTATAYKDIGGALWTASGTKAVEAYFVYEAA